jgi:hypothetical protein
MEQRLVEAYNDLMTRLFDHVPSEPSKLEVNREMYKQAMIAVQEEHNLTEGDPEFSSWVLLLLFRSPKFTNAKGDDHNGRDTTEGDGLGSSSPS